MLIRQTILLLAVIAIPAMAAEKKAAQSPTTTTTASSAPQAEYAVEQQKLADYWQSQLSNPKPLLRKSALHNLTVLKAQQALPTIAVLMRDKDAEVRQAAVRAVGALGDEKALKPLKDVSNRDADANVRRQAGRAMDQIKERLQGKTN